MLDTQGWLVVVAVVGGPILLVLALIERDRWRDRRAAKGGGR